MNLQSALTIAFKHIEKAPVQLWNREPKLTGALYLCVSCQWTRNYVVISTFWHTCQQLIPNHNYFVGAIWIGTNLTTEKCIPAV